MNKLGVVTRGATPASAWRDDAFAALGVTAFDLLVIGGGITGCGIARDATLRGLRVALCERHDFASGTSSRSSRLIHGGVRYLEHGHLHLVFESSRERRRLLRIAPHLVRPLPFTWPVYEGARVAQWKLLTGLTLYDALALFRNVGNHRRLTRGAVLEREPALRGEGLLGGARYWDAATDDSRLTLANALAATRDGATVLNHAAVVAFVMQGGRATGAVVRDALTGREVTVEARRIVSAAGPWTDAVQAMEAAHDRPAVLGSVGVHIAVPRHRVGNREAVTLVAPEDGRVFFVLPAGDHAIIGTTEAPARRGPDEVRATREDVRYLLQSCNAFFPNALLQDHDVVAAWAGVRPLAATLAEGDSGSASREHTIAERASGVITVTGGKLTTYRAMAEEVVDRVVLGSEARDGRPFRETLLPGGNIVSLAEVEREAAGAIGDDAVAARLARGYGSAWREVWALTREEPSLRERIEPSLPYSFAEARHAFERELACTLGDVLIRRMHLAFETRDHGEGAARRVALRLAPRLGWDAARVEQEVARYANEAERVFAIDP